MVKMKFSLHNTYFTLETSLHHKYVRIYDAIHSTREKIALVLTNCMCIYLLCKELSNV